MKLVLGPDKREARKFARELGSGWEGEQFGTILTYQYSTIVIIQPLKIELKGSPRTLREYIWDSVKKLLSPGNERNIYVL